MIQQRVLFILGFFLSITALPAVADHASVGFGVGTASPISTISAVTLPEGRWAVGVRSEVINLDGYSDRKLGQLHEADEDADLHSVDSLMSNSLNAAFGVTEDFTVGIRVPFIHRNDIKEPEHGHGAEEEQHEEEEEEHHEEEGPPEIVKLGDVEGIGDITVFGEYRFYKNKGTNAALLFGVKAPTGKTRRKSDGGELLELELQPGSGSWDGLVGAAFTQEMGPFSFDASLLYSIVTEGKQHTDLGDVFSYNAALSYRLFGQQGLDYLPPKFAVDVVTELNGEWREREKTRGKYDPNSGGDLVYLSPGIRVAVGTHASIGFSVGFPIINDSNGHQVEPHNRYVSSVNVSW